MDKGKELYDEYLKYENTAKHLEKTDNTFKKLSEHFKALRLTYNKMKIVGIFSIISLWLYMLYNVCFFDLGSNSFIYSISLYINGFIALYCISEASNKRYGYAIFISSFCLAFYYYYIIKYFTLQFGINPEYIPYMGGSTSLAIVSCVYLFMSRLSDLSLDIVFKRRMVVEHIEEYLNKDEHAKKGKSDD